MEEAIIVARYLETRYGKKEDQMHSYYEDDKIRITYNTHYGSIDVCVKMPDRTLFPVLICSGLGHTREYHSGKWEDYIRNELYPKALLAKKKQEEESEKKQAEEEAKKTAPCSQEINDIFVKE